MDSKAAGLSNLYPCPTLQFNSWPVAISLSLSLLPKNKSQNFHATTVFKKTFCWQTHVIGIRKLLSLCCAFSSGIRDRAVVPQNNWHHFGISNSIYLLLQRVNIYIVHAKTARLLYWWAAGWLGVSLRSLLWGAHLPGPLGKEELANFLLIF